jgi:hypothetical protein
MTDRSPVLPLQHDLHEVLAAVPGVVAVYPERPAAVALIDAALAVATGRQEPLPVSVAEHDGLFSVAATIGIADDAGAADTCRRAYGALAAHLAAQGVAVGRIRILVATVERAPQPLVLG